MRKILWGALIAAALFLCAGVDLSATEIRQGGMYASSGLGVTGDHRLGNTCVVSAGGRTYCGLNASHLSFFADNTVSLELLYQLALASDNGINGYFLRSNGDNTFSWAAAAGGATTSLPWGNITSKPTNIDNLALPGNWKVGYSNGSGQWTFLTLGASGTYLHSNGATTAPDFDTPAGTGDFSGPASSTDNAIVVFDGTGGKTGKNSLVTIDNTGKIAAPGGVDTGTGTDGQRRIAMRNNTSISPIAATDEIYFEGDILKVNENGTERTVAKTDSNITGNAATATALASNGANCSAGQAPLGVDASGAAEGCWTPGTGSDIWPSGGAVDNSVALFDNTTGKLKSSPMIVGTDNIMRGLAGIDTPHVDNTAYFNFANSGLPTATDNGDTYYDNTLKRYLVFQDGEWKRMLDNTDLVSVVVPASRTVNGHALSSDVTLAASDLTTGTIPMEQLGSSGSRDNTTVLLGDGAWATRTVNWGVSFQSPAAVAAALFQRADARYTVDNIALTFLDNTGKLPGSALDNGTIQILSCSALGSPTCDNVTAPTAIDSAAVNYPAIVTAVITAGNWMQAKITALGRAATYLSISVGVIAHVTP